MQCFKTCKSTNDARDGHDTGTDHPLQTIRMQLLKCHEQLQGRDTNPLHKKCMKGIRTEETK